LVADALSRREIAVDVAIEFDNVGTLCIISFPTLTWLYDLKTSYESDPAI